MQEVGIVPFCKTDSKVRKTSFDSISWLLRSVIFVYLSGCDRFDMNLPPETLEEPSFSTWLL